MDVRVILLYKHATKRYLRLMKASFSPLEWVNLRKNYVEKPFPFKGFIVGFFHRSWLRKQSGRHPHALCLGSHSRPVPRCLMVGFLGEFCWQKTQKDCVFSTKKWSQPCLTSEWELRFWEMMEKIPVFFHSGYGTWEPHHLWVSTCWKRQRSIWINTKGVGFSDILAVA